MALDGLIICGVAALASLYELHAGPVKAARLFWSGTLIHGYSTSITLVLLLEFIVALMIISRRFNLYSPMRLRNLLHEQWLSVQACLTSGLLLTGTLYFVKAQDIPRSMVLVIVGVVTIVLSLRRLVYRVLMYSRFDRGMGTRNVLIVGTGHEALALRRHLESIRHLGYTFKGFVDYPASNSRLAVSSSDVVSSLETLFQNARKVFVDEIFFTGPIEPDAVSDALEQARRHGVDLRIVPELYGGSAWTTPIEYIGQFPTIPLHRGHVPEIGLLFKRFLDVSFSALVLIVFLPVILAIAVAVKMDSHGPVFYVSERIGQKGRVFRCIKFRTMVRDAENRRAEVLHMNERDGVLFKISNDPRITRIGQLLRKYSLDELPQFLNVLHGDMSIVGPRPPIASEVREYKLSHLRRLDVIPGITGLWQVQARQDPSFDSYVSLDMTYIENWSLWLDIKIILRTVGVIFAGTGS
jgi:exopolysaccharide biosynthesis polyprenyl glycosylphosphotransferase